MAKTPTNQEDSSDFVRRLRKLDCCTVSDALDRLQLEGVVTGLRQLSGQGRIAGRAVTVKLGLGAPPAGPARHLGTTAIQIAGPESVIVVEQRTGVDAGCWGGLLTLGARQRGIAGVIADGPVRDIDEACDHGFPIFGNRTTSLTARGRVVEKGTNVPVRIGHQTVAPSHYVIADGSAVAFIAPGKIEEVLTVAETIAAREAAMARDIAAGKTLTEVMGTEYEDMLKERQS